MFHSVIGYHLETMKYEVRDKIMKVEYRNATDRMSLFRATGDLYAIPNSCKKDICSHIFFPLDHYRFLYLKKRFLVQAEKYMTIDLSGVDHCDLRPIGS